MWPGAVIAALLLQSASPTAPDWQAEGLRALEQKNYPAAVEALTKAVAADPKDYSLHFNLALADSLAGRDAEGISEYRKTLELKPGLYQANLNLGILLLRDKQAEAALPLLEAARTAKPNEFRPAFYLAEGLFASGKIDAAGDAYQAALKIDPNSAGAELGLARVFARRKELADAAPHFERAAQLEPAYNDALLELADLYESAKKTAEAIALFSKFPGNAAAQERAGEMLLSVGNNAEAIPHLEIAVQLSPTSANRLALAHAYLGNQEREKGVAVLNQALAADPKNYDLRMLAGRFLRDLKQYPNAVNQFLQAISLKPESIEAWDEIVTCYMLSDNYPQAMAALDKLKALGAETTPHFYLRAIMLDKLKQLQPALEYYQRFLAAAQGKYPDEEFKSRQRVRIIQRELSKR
jgi:tetratricopeptide (TPR) repeat protein